MDLRAVPYEFRNIGGPGDQAPAPAPGRHDQGVAAGSAHPALPAQPAGQQAGRAQGHRPGVPRTRQPARSAQPEHARPARRPAPGHHDRRPRPARTRGLDHPRPRPGRPAVRRRERGTRPQRPDVPPVLRHEHGDGQDLRRLHRGRARRARRLPAPRDRGRPGRGRRPRHRLTLAPRTATSDFRQPSRAEAGRIEGVELDFERCYRAVDSRDRRFDGWFVTAVSSTGIYCRPSCPAITPKRRNVRFYPSAAAAQRNGFRACRRCRPDAAPGSPEWDVRADVVGRAMRLIGDGVVDRAGVPGLAGRLGYTERHLHRMLNAELGAGPLALARAQRAQTARTLVETTKLGLAEIAFAAGFGSVRQFNDTIREIYGRAPSQLRGAVQREDRSLRGPRSQANGTAVASAANGAAGTITLRLPCRAPLYAPALFGFLAARAIPGVESSDGLTYERALRLPNGTATVALSPREGYLQATLRLTEVRDLAPAVARCRRLLDLDADPEAVDAVLAAD